MSDMKADLARGARVELALRAAEQGDTPTALGILAGMADIERKEYGELVLATLARYVPETVSVLRATWAGA